MAAAGQGGDKAAMLVAFDKQIGWCISLGAPFTGRVLTVLAADIARDGRAAGLVSRWTGDPVADAAALRLAAALHALVLTGADPALSACYPPAGEGGRGLRTAILAALHGHAGFLRGFVASPPQTNEVGRAAVLLGGFLQVAASTRLPLRLLEIGSSAGLNLIWDRYHYRLGDGQWGDSARPVRLQPLWQGPTPPLQPLDVAHRAGCDLAPIDLERHDARLRLRSYVWADQPERSARIEAAIAMAREAGIAVERADAAPWLRTRLASPVPGCATVVFHSIMWQYLPEPTRLAVRDTIDRAGARASRAAALAWLRFEPPAADARPELHLTLWLGGRQHRLAFAHPHGKRVQWLGAPTV